ncbi:MAG: class I SAM-dependent methyltransferase [Candidatus Thorarchaeota archaeon]|nr:class I SAM-dependent methyltransferase [Candidatus Thorarchaeota archaeon]
MLLNHLSSLQCPKCQGKLNLSDTSNISNRIPQNTLYCDNGHCWQIKDGIVSLNYPKFLRRKETDVRGKMLRGLSEEKDSLNLSLEDIMKPVKAFIPAHGGIRILELSAGGFTSYLLLKDKLSNLQGTLELHALDSNSERLNHTMHKIYEGDIPVTGIHGNETHAPYPSEWFDLVFQIGQLSTFRSKETILKEMLRLVAPSGSAVVLDWGMSPKIRDKGNSEGLLKNLQPLANRPPLESLPNEVDSAEIEYVARDLMFCIRMQK